MKSTTLYYQRGASDKVYAVTLESQPQGWMVCFTYGRRGSTLSAGTKTQTPVSLEEANRIFDILIREKIAKGYTVGESTTPYTTTSKRATGIHPQLSNPVSSEEMRRLLIDDDFLLQPKLDGRRLLVLRRGDSVTGINRRGLECGLPETIRLAALRFEGDFLLDGEAIGNELHAFDLLEWKGKDYREQTCKGRLIGLLILLASGQQSAIQWVTTVYGEKKKIALFHKLRTENAEGVVFKRASSPYVPDRPASGGDHLKFKFVETASVLVTGWNTRRSVSIGVFEDGEIVSAGNVAIPPDHPVPEAGDVVEVRYLYAIPESGALFQPVYLGARDDILPSECCIRQLKYKRKLMVA